MVYTLRACNPRAGTEADGGAALNRLYSTSIQSCAFEAAGSGREPRQAGLPWADGC
jgi:hypothetical protein